jgi:asparagine synthase (glutamine-hydrolysing)
MCGIYGFVAASGDLGPPELVHATLTAMDRAIIHRGPDDNGSYVDARCAMGMRRLSIIDLGGGKQPISNEDQRLWVVFNGEIYNYRQLRDDLLVRSHHFTTTSDTEVLVHLYEERGPALVDALAGMFGFAIWDKERQELLLARDRLGIKPLYFAPTPRGLVFGSELKSLIQHPDVRRVVSPEALSHYLSFGTTPRAQSILDGVCKLLPGHLLRYRRGDLSLHRYWEPPYDRPATAMARRSSASTHVPAAAPNDAPALSNSASAQFNDAPATSTGAFAQFNSAFAQFNDASAPSTQVSARSPARPVRLAPSPDDAIAQLNSEFAPDNGAYAPQSMTGAASRLRGLIRAAVRSHLVADVPVGAFLSGGIDSATVVGTMAELGARPKTFSIGFDEADFNELHWARLVARQFGTDHHELVVRPDAWALTEQLPWFLDEPFADVSAVPTFLVSKLAAAQVKVVLSGDGGDEIFAGYDRYARAEREQRLFRWLPGPARRALGALALRLPDGTRGKNYLRHVAQDVHLRYVDGDATFPTHAKERLLGPELRHQLAAQNCATAQSNAERLAMLARTPGDLVHRLMHLDLATYLPLDILTKVDRMTMAHSLEARPPLLDHLLVEHALRLPTRLKLDADGTQKAILKRAVADLLPSEILHRPKRGFGVPIRQWFRGPLAEPARALLTDKRFIERGWIDPLPVRALIDEHARGRRDRSLPMWSLLMLELWCRRFLDNTNIVQLHNLEIAHG